MTFVHERHKPPTPLARERELVLVCAPLRSNVNLARILRAAACSGVRRVVACGNPKVDTKVARLEPGPDGVRLEIRRSLAPVLRRLAGDGYQLVGLEQTRGSASLYEFSFARRTALVVGNERAGLSDAALGLLHQVVEIPVYGMPHSHNVATAAAIALYEYCRQFPRG